MRKMTSWAWGWIETLRIMIFDRELYRSLTRDFNPDEFADVTGFGACETSEYPKFGAEEELNDQ